MSNALIPVQSGRAMVVQAKAGGDAQAQFVTMVIAGQMFGIPVLDVRDVLRAQTMTRIPLAPAWVAGALNLRGRIVTAIDVRARLGLEPSVHGTDGMSIVVDHKGELYSLVVDEVGEVMEFDVSRVEPNPATLDVAWREISSGIVQLDGRLLIVMSVDRLFVAESLEAA